MEKVSSLSNIQIYQRSEGTPTLIDTTFVLFFLAVDIGQNLGRFGFDTAIFLIVLALVAIFPFFMAENNISLGKWLAGRGLIAGFAILLGAVFNQTLGTVFPETFRFIPFTLLILTAMVSCYVQFYNFFKFRISN